MDVLEGQAAGPEAARGDGAPGRTVARAGGDGKPAAGRVSLAAP
jgi:hypothetical protein